MFLIFSAGLLAMPSEPFEAAVLMELLHLKTSIYHCFTQTLNNRCSSFRQLMHLEFSTQFCTNRGGPGHFLKH